MEEDSHTPNKRTA